MLPRARYLIATAALGGVAVVAACTTFSSSAPSSSFDAGRDAALGDGNVESFDSGITGDANTDAGTDGSADPTNLLPTDTAAFTSGCASWTGNGADVASDDAGRTASGSCRVCTKTSLGGGIYLDLPLPIEAGTYAAQAYVMDPSSAPPASVPVSAVLRYNNDSGSTGAVTPAKPGTWSLVMVQRQAVDGGGMFQVQFNSTLTGSCFLIDDASLYRVEE